MLTIKPIKTTRFTLGDDLWDFLDQHLPQIVDGDILVVTSKIVSLAEKRVVAKLTDTKAEKHALVKKEADWYLPASRSKYHVMLTIKDGTLAVNAGIDESNINAGYYLLLPQNAYASAAKIWRYLKEKYQINQVGVIISDSMTTSLIWGVFGNSLAHCGFQAINSKIGQKGLFGRPMKMTKINLPHSIAQAAVFAMGEVDEAQPLALVRGVAKITKIQFQNRPPTKKEIESIYIDLKDDIYAPVLTAAAWESSK